jgi:hypothetical protein
LGFVYWDLPVIKPDAEQFRLPGGIFSIHSLSHSLSTLL